MTGSSKVIAGLKMALPLEGQLNLQYRHSTRSLKFMGAKKTAAKMDSFGDDASDWRDAVDDQLLFLSGDAPDGGYAPGPVAGYKTLTEMLTAALAQELAIVAGYERNIPVAAAEFDDESRNLMEHLVKWHREHQRWIEKQLRLIAAAGETEYLLEKL